MIWNFDPEVVLWQSWSFLQWPTEQERIDDLIHPANVHHVQIKLGKWIAVQLRAQRPCLIRFFKEPPSDNNDDDNGNNTICY